MRRSFCILILLLALCLVSCTDPIDSGSVNTESDSLAIDTMRLFGTLDDLILYCENDNEHSIYYYPFVESIAKSEYVDFEGYNVLPAYVEYNSFYPTYDDYVNFYIRYKCKTEKNEGTEPPVLELRFEKGVLEYVKDIPQRSKFDENLQVYFADVDGKGKAYIYIFNDDTYGAVTIPDIYSIEEKEAIGKQFSDLWKDVYTKAFAAQEKGA